MAHFPEGQCFHSTRSAVPDTRWKEPQQAANGIQCFKVLVDFDRVMYQQLIMAEL